ncbi:sensor histidine kinase [Hyalangium rubrum]|uniref:histidine kinase n=1 Tax=Hyalangium rubrum TaxID=3103134 RepID=A0ABU5HAQ8_9BACT|nr:ATP-binding protein [Hyalangium sp. s54d21]MDY7230169.1 ATP-binding protein [Hyalangium sp. s54d21]
MTMRAKVLLFAAVAVGLMGAMGGALFQGAFRGQWLRVRLASVHQQLGLYDQMYHRAWDFLERLRQASSEGQDTRGLRVEYERGVAEALAKLEASIPEERGWDEVKEDPNELRYLADIHQAQRQWATRVEAMARSASAQAPLSPEVWWRGFTDFEKEVGPHIAQADGAKREKLRVMRQLFDQSFRSALRVGTLVPLLCVVLVGVLAGLILVPLQRELRELRMGAERIGQGHFEVELPARRRDELGALASAFNRMAAELRQTLEEKQRLMQAEAQAAEREFRRYNALLEETVHTRTAQLETANVQLADSLQRLRDTQAQLMFADRLASMGRLAAGVGHEINNPLAYVLSNLNFVNKELGRALSGTPEEERTELLSAMADARDGAEKVRVIVQDLKTLSRPDDASLGSVELGAVVRGAVKMAAHEIRRRARLVEDLSQAPAVQGNAARLGQVFLNLLLNAAHAIPEGKAEQNEIRVSARPGEPGQVLVEVSDTGSGIAPEHLERIFDPFFTTKPMGQGTGLGLSVCHSIITTLGGRIGVVSEPGKGTTFRLVLPMAPVEQQARPGAAA